MLNIPVACGNSQRGGAMKAFKLMSTLRGRWKAIRNFAGYVLSSRKYRKFKYRDVEILLSVTSAWEYARATGGFETYPLDCFFDLGISPEEDVYYEIGSCNSIASLIMSKVLSRNRIAVVAFEPEASNVHATWINMRLNSASNMVIIPIALSEKNNVEYIHLCSKKVAPGQGGHSFDKDYGWGEMLVPVLTLDKVIEVFNLPCPTLISIDVEGHELAVLRGMKRLLSERPKVVRCLVVEVWKSEDRILKVNQLMKEYG